MNTEHVSKVFFELIGMNFFMETRKKSANMHQIVAMKWSASNGHHRFIRTGKNSTEFLKYEME